MGSSFTTCSISGMSLTNQKTSIQLLVPSWRDKVVFDEKGVLCSNSGCQHSYSPFGFPINGMYDDASQIEDIVRDKNVEVLEKYFNLSISNVIEAASDDRWYKHGVRNNEEDWALPTIDGGEIKNIDILLVMTTTHFRTEVYKFLSTNYISAEFESSGIDGRFNRMIRNLPDANIECEVIVNDKYSVVAAYVIERYPDTSTKKFMKLAKEVMNKIGDDTLEPDVDARMTTLAQGMLTKTHKSDMFYINSICKYNFIQLMNLDSSFKDDMYEQYTFLWSMSSLYKNLFPSNYGGQDENFRQLKKLNDLVDTLLVSDIRDQHYD